MARAPLLTRALPGPADAIGRLGRFPCPYNRRSAGTVRAALLGTRRSRSGTLAESDWRIPTPTLLKAALIATARSLGPVDAQTQAVTCTGGDCRPSNESGWGLVDLDRLTNPEVGVFVHNEEHSFTGAGQSWTSPWLKAFSADEEILIAVVWNDIPVSPANEALQRDLDVFLTDSGSGFSVGNNFHENAPVGTPLDDGYSTGFGLVDASVRDRVNNVEAIFLPPGVFTPTGQAFRLTVVSHAHAIPDGTAYPTQQFSIYAWNVGCWKVKGNGACSD